MLIILIFVKEKIEYIGDVKMDKLIDVYFFKRYNINNLWVLF